MVLRVQCSEISVRWFLDAGFFNLIVIPQLLIPISSFQIGAFGRLCAFVPLCLCTLHLTASTLTPEESETYYEKALNLYGGVEEEADYDGAARLAKAAANAGHVKAQVLFGYMHSRGLGARRSWSRAAYWWRRAAEQGYAPALFNLATLYWFGIGVREDYAEARGMLERIVEPAVKVADSMEDYSLFQVILAESYWRLGLAYQNGFGVGRNRAKAAQLFEKAAVAGNYQAMLQTGLHYALGEVFPADTDRADFYLNMAMARAGQDVPLELRSFHLEGIEREDKYREELKEIRKREREMLAYLQMSCGVTLFNKSDRKGENLYGMARHWLRLAAEAGQPQAKTYLGLQYLLGLGGETDFAKAALLLGEAAVTGMSLAAYYYAIMLHQGLGIEKDPGRAAIYFRRAERSCLYPAIEAVMNPGAAVLQPPARLVEATGEAAATDLTARACFGFALGLGFGLPKDPARALRILEECAGAGNPVGQFALAQTLMAGRGARFDGVRAFQLFEKAAAQGHLWAKLEVGLLLQQGRGARSNRHGKALAYFADCMAAGIPAAKSNLGLMYLEGRGVKSNARKAEELLLAAHEQGARKARLILGHLYYNGRGKVARDYERARKFYELAAEEGFNEANFYLGEIYARGWGVESAFQQAALYYRAAARGGHAEAAFRLGMLFKEGRKVALNYDVAAYWLQVAALGRHNLAYYHFSEMLEFGWGVAKNEKAAYEAYQSLLKQDSTPLAHLGKARCELFGKGGAPRRYSSIAGSLKRLLKIDEASASAYLGICYHHWAHAKEKINRSYLRRSLEYFDRSVELNSPVGLTELAKLHLGNKIEKASTLKAMELLTRAADLRYPEAAFLLAKAHVDGIEGAPGAEACIEYLNLAVDGQIEGSEELLRQLENESGTDRPIPVYSGAPA